ncbi:unnamed protein product [Durusdinium trenchii]|uniref:Uncharacterized protein n=1 Tax=Durusdinium trenchii TaxID=1381693 RepID=A0ABP0KWN9_9DINO
MASPPEDPLHWKNSLTLPPQPESHGDLPNREPEDSSRIGFWDLQTSRMPTPQPWDESRARSATPSACIHASTQPLARSAALDQYARASSACGSSSARCSTRAATTTPTTARPSRLSWRERSPFELEEEERPYMQSERKEQDRSSRVFFKAKEIQRRLRALCFTRSSSDDGLHPMPRRTTRGPCAPMRHRRD